MKITATDLYSYVTCPHRVWRDAFDDQSLKDPPNEFVQLLWEKGVRHEKEVIEKQKGNIKILDLSQIPVEERFVKTIEAMKQKVSYIYQGRLEVDELVGKPDLLEHQGDGQYVPIDIKSGMGNKEGSGDEEQDGKLKKDYAVQIALYIDALIRLGFLKSNLGKILDSRGIIVDYDLSMPRGVRTPQTWWEFYLDILNQVRNLYAKQFQTEAALASECKMCEWYSDCKKQMISSNDITLIPELGRSKKDSLKVVVKTTRDLASMEVKDFLIAKNKLGIKGIAEDSFIKLNRRAKLLTSGEKGPLILGQITFPQKPIELFFDIEADPTQDIVYLHGVVERRERRKELIFHPFVAKEVSREEEKRAWAEFWTYIHTLPQDEWAMYYYSKYERTQYRILAQRYPDVIAADEVEKFFDPAQSIDLYYDVVKKYTEWPTYNYSVKTLAQHLGFNWRDKNPSGAASIQWFNEWCVSKDSALLQRIIDYNEDDCLAMVILKDKLMDYVY